MPSPVFYSFLLNIFIFIAQITQDIAREFQNSLLA